MILTNELILIGFGVGTANLEAYFLILVMQLISLITLIIVLVYLYKIVKKSDSLNDVSLRTWVWSLLSLLLLIGSSIVTYALGQNPVYMFWNW